MNDQEIIDRLSGLVKLDIDAVNAYERAIERIRDERIRETILNYRNDHEGHISNLSVLISELGGEPPERSQDIQGKLMEAVTTMRSITGTVGALKAMRTNEETTNRVYEKAVEWEIREDVHRQLERNFEDEKKHLAFISNELEKMKARAV